MFSHRIIGLLCSALLLGCGERDVEPETVEPETAARTTATPDPEVVESAPVLGGEALYQENCAYCHEGGVPKAPHKMFLEMLAADSILAAMTNGVMQNQSAMLSETERKAIAEYLAGTELAAMDSPALPARCAAEERRFDFDRPPTSSGWGVNLGNTRFVDARSAGLTAEQLPRLKLRWAFGFPNALRARSEPGIGGGSLFVGSQDGTVYSLNAKTGCLRWTFRASAEVRTAIVVSPWTAGDNNAKPKLYFGDLLARAYALDARTGALLWMQKVDDHPNATITGSPTLVDDRLLVPVSSLEVTSAADPSYPCCSFQGSIVALAADSGEQLWKQRTIDTRPQPVATTAVGTPVLAPSGAPIWNSPSVDVAAGLVYAGTGENYSSPADGNSDALIALDLATGAKRWVFQATPNDAWNVACMLPEGRENCPVEDGPDFDFGAATMLVETANGKRLVGGQKSGEAFGLDPNTGELKWRQRLGRGGIQAGIHFGMAADGERLYIPISDFDDDQAHELPARPGMFALNARTGDVAWHSPHENRCGDREHCDPGISAPATAIAGAVLAGAMDGMLRAYEAGTGKVLWEFDTARDFETLGGFTAQGGTIGGGSGPVVSDGMIYMTSGYGMYFHMPGNVLLAFGVD